MIKHNVPISTVSGMLGHSQIGTTVNIYTHVIEDAKKEAMNVMSKIINAKKQKCDIKCDINAETKKLG